MGKFGNFIRAAVTPFGSRNTTASEVGRVGQFLFDAFKPNNVAKENPDVKAVDTFIKKAGAIVIGSIIPTGTKTATQTTTATAATTDSNMGLSNSQISAITTGVLGLFGSSTKSDSPIADSGSTFTATADGNLGVTGGKGGIAWLPVIAVVVVVVGVISLIVWIVKPKRGRR